jgi:predicted Rossmann fold flavoprotein
MVIYGYSLYISAKWHHTGKIYWNLTLCTLWFLSAILWLRKLGILAKEERENLVKIIKNLPVHISGTRGYNEAIITKGGISTKEINPKTMESKIMPNIYFVGEVLDLDAMTGGYNLQIAWSTGYLAGNSIY